MLYEHYANKIEWVMDPASKRQRLDSIPGLDNGIIQQDASMQKVPAARRKCPYLDTINRQFLDFDNEKICCITLADVNVYACLVCGKYFQGRGKSSVAYTHSVDQSHFVFINLTDEKVRSFIAFVHSFIHSDHFFLDILSSWQLWSHWFESRWYQTQSISHIYEWTSVEIRRKLVLVGPGRVRRDLSPWLHRPEQFEENRLHKCRSSYISSHQTNSWLFLVKLSEW